MTTKAAFYCISSELYFPGAVGLINSLRLHGHREPIFVLDCGLSDAHRGLLAREATIVAADASVPPYLLKTLAPRAHPAETMILIDVDMVVTRPLTPLIDQASPGRVVAFEDNIDRFVAEWGAELELGPCRRLPYVSSGLVALGGAIGNDVVRLWDERREIVDYERSWFARNDPDYPFLFLDQDLLNGILCCRAEPEQLLALDRRLAPHQPYRGLRITDERRLRCSYRDGSEPYLLHQYLGKPWIDPMYHGIYSRLLSRLWLGPDVALELNPAEVPRRMRRGVRALLDRKLTDAWDLQRWYRRDVIPEWFAARRGASARKARGE